jgi:molybdopterin synthase catalytic subunit
MLNTFTCVVLPVAAIIRKHKERNHSWNHDDGRVIGSLQRYIAETSTEVDMEIVTESPLDPGKLFETLWKNKAGSVIFHYAVVKSRTGEKQSSGIRFERNGDMESELKEIAGEMRNRWNLDDVLLVRRIGELHVGDLISLVAVSSPASNDAFEACRYGLARLRKMESLKKTELYLD